jgi:hypothetical protein
MPVPARNRFHFPPDILKSMRFCDPVEGTDLD